MLLHPSYLGSLSCAEGIAIQQSKFQRPSFHVFFNVFFSDFAGLENEAANRPGACQEAATWPDIPATNDQTYNEDH